jgi:hypothetical protein
VKRTTKDTPELAKRMATIREDLDVGRTSVADAQWMYDRVIELEAHVRGKHYDPRYDPYVRAQEEFRLNGWLREIIIRACQDLEHLGNQRGRTPAAKELLLRRAALMRGQAHQGPPRGWQGTGARGSDRSDEERAAQLEEEDEG